MDHSQQAAERTAMDKTIYITMDMDWANDDVLADSVSLAEQLNIPVCLFVTNDTPMLRILRQHPLYTLGIHPNFLPQLNGQTTKSYRETMSEMLRIEKKKKIIRCHALPFLPAFRSGPSGISADSSACRFSMKTMPGHWNRVTPLRNSIFLIPVTNSVSSTFTRSIFISIRKTWSATTGRNPITTNLRNWLPMSIMGKTSEPGIFCCESSSWQMRTTSASERSKNYGIDPLI